MKNLEIKPLGIVPSLAIYGFAAILLYVITSFAIPYLSEATGQETILFWFIMAGLGVFLPLLITAWIILKNEGYTLNTETWTTRMRFRKMSKRDWKWTLLSIVIVMVISGLVMQGLTLILGEFDHTPPFMAFEPLSSGRYWLLAVWLPYWVLNIMGEEILWRGVMLPRQEVALGKNAWIFHGLGWGLFHIAFGWQLLITLVPLILIQSYVVQRTQNSWTGVIMHGGINGPSFIAISFGLI